MSTPPIDNKGKSPQKTPPPEGRLDQHTVEKLNKQEKISFVQEKIKESKMPGEGKAFTAKWEAAKTSFFDLLRSIFPSFFKKPPLTADSAYKEIRAETYGVDWDLNKTVPYLTALSRYDFPGDYEEIFLDRELNGVQESLTRSRFGVVIQMKARLMARKDDLTNLDLERAIQRVVESKQKKIEDSQNTLSHLVEQNVQEKRKSLKEAKDALDQRNKIADFVSAFILNRAYKEVKINHGNEPQKFYSDYVTKNSVTLEKEITDSLRESGIVVPDNLNEIVAMQAVIKSSDLK